MKQFKLRHAALLILLAGLNGGASCVSDGGDTYDHRNSGGYGNNDWNRDDSDRPGRIPRRADVVREGTGKLKWTADLDGTVYVYDRNRDTIRYTGPARRGQEIIVQPNDNQVLIDGRVVYDQDLTRDSSHQLYFVANNSDWNRDRDNRDSRDRNDRPGRPEPREELPYGASRLERGDGDIDIKRIPQGGTVYVYDETAGKILLRTNVRKNTRFGVDVREQRTYVDGVASQRIKLPKGHAVGVYLVDR